MLSRNGNTFCESYATYRDRIRQRLHNRIAVQIEFPDDGYRAYAMVDTGSAWLFLPRHIWQGRVEQYPQDGTDELTVRGWDVTGQLRRVPIIILAESGRSVEIEVTAFCAPENLNQPIILGYQRCLECLRFAVDPSPERRAFYFAPRGGD